MALRKKQNKNLRKLAQLIESEKNVQRKTDYEFAFVDLIERFIREGKTNKKK